MIKLKEGMKVRIIIVKGYIALLSILIFTFLYSTFSYEYENCKKNNQIITQCNVIYEGNSTILIYENLTRRFSYIKFNQSECFIYNNEINLEKYDPDLNRYITVMITSSILIILFHLLYMITSLIICSEIPGYFDASEIPDF